MKKLIAWAACAVATLTAPAHADLPDFTQLVEKQSPAVVLVTTEAEVQADNPFGEMDDPMLEWFRRFGFGGRAQQPQRPQKSRGLGSGFIIDSQGYVLTNAHVIDRADDITIKLSDKRELKAELIGMDRRTDVALLKVKAQNLPQVAIGSPEKLKVGEWIVAIGSSLGFENTVTAGIVSAKERMIDEDGLVPFIQHSAPINQGNSGGPLFNTRGEVVGINSRIYTPNQGFVGLSFSIPIDLAMNVAQQLRESGKVSRGRLGVVLQPMSESLAAGFGLEKARGAIVAKLLPDSAADKAGIKVGDVILAVNGRPVDKPGELSREIASSRGGQAVKLDLLQNRKTRQVSVVLDEAIDEQAANSPKPNKAKAQKEGRSVNVGLVVEPLPAAQLKRMKLDFGLYVHDVSGPAQEAGIQPGDVIVGVVGQTVKSLEDFDKALRPGAKVALQILRRDDVFFAPLNVPAGK